jgi:hypothetical protein
MVGQSYDSITLLGVKDVMLFQRCQAILYICIYINKSEMLNY